MKELVANLQKLGVLKTRRIVAAFLAVDRRDFVPREEQNLAYVDVALPLRAGQTISQPYTVAFMMELLDPQPGQKILDIGFGSGWTTAILADVVGPPGQVYGIEIVPEIFAFGQANLAKFSLPNIELKLQSGSEGLAEAAPFDRILVSAAARKIPPALKNQLAIGGKMVIPIGSGSESSLVLWQKHGLTDFTQKIYPGFAFVPFVR